MTTASSTTKSTSSTVSVDNDDNNDDVTVPSSSLLLYDTFDYVIVGGGTSAMGLLYGLLSSSASTRTNNNTNTSKENTSKIRIALIERGDMVDSGSNTANDSNTASTTYDPLIRPLHRWCAASHPTYLNNPNSKMKNHRTKTITTTNAKVYEGRLYSNSNTDTTSSTDTNKNQGHQKSMFHRIIDVSTGYGLGGTTLINAGLVIPPTLHDFTSNTSQWPINISSKIMTSIKAIVTTMDENQCLYSSMNQSNNESNDPSSSLLLFETKVPSTLINVPCSVSKRLPVNGKDDDSNSNSNSSTTTTTYQRVSYYESLVEPLLQQQEQNNNNNNNNNNSMFDVTILTGYNVERLIITKENEQQQQNNTKECSQPKCTGVEVMNRITNVYTRIDAKYDIIICTGTIMSPILLLVSGIGHTTLLPKYVVPISNETQKANVGYKLKDHVLLPRMIITKPDPIIMNNKNHNALNGVRAITNLKLETMNTTTATNSNNDNIPIESITAQTQISLMDSAAYIDLIPIMGAAPFRYQCDIDVFMKWIQSKRYIPNIFKHPIVPYMINVALNIMYHCIQILFHILIIYTPFYYIAKYCIKVIAIFIMNAQSEGKITISLKDEHDTKQQPQLCRVSDVNVHIDLGYLSHPNDIIRFQQAFNASYNVYDTNNTLGTICEIFPGGLVKNTIHNNNNNKSDTNNDSSSNIIFHPKRFEFMAHGFVLPYFHWIGTCSMKPNKQNNSMNDNNNNNNNNSDDDDDWVVDETFRVRGVQNLRICDASIFPSLVSVPTALTCAGLGHVLSQYILNDIMERDKKK